MKTYVGIDNGVTGALAFLKEGEPHLLRTPTTEQGGRTYIDVVTIHHLLRTLLPNAFVVCELAQPNPTFGAKGNYSSGRSEGTYDAILKLLGIPHMFVPARTWQKDLHEGIRKAGQDTKSASIEACTRLFPAVNLIPTGCRKPSDAFADALLMAEWSRRKNL